MKCIYFKVKFEAKITRQQIANLKLASGGRSLVSSLFFLSWRLSLKTGVGGGGLGGEKLRLHGDKVLKVSAQSLQTHEKCFCQVTREHP